MKLAFSYLIAIMMIYCIAFLNSTPGIAGLQPKSAPVISNKQRRIAFVVGNSNYNSTPRLRNSANDARAIADKLSKLDFKVTLGLDLTQRQFAKKFKEFGQSLSRSDVALFYYAGHGLQLNGTNYLFPIDAVNIHSESDILNQAIDFNSIIRIMEDGAPTRILILDACRNNPISGTLISAGSARQLSTEQDALKKYKKKNDVSDASQNKPLKKKTTGQQEINENQAKVNVAKVKVQRGLAKVKGRAGTYIAFATDPGGVAQDGAKDHSPFAQAIIETIMTPGWTIDKLFQEVRRRVLKYTQQRQTPWSNTALIEDFYFVAESAPSIYPIANEGIQIDDPVLTTKLVGRSFEINGISASLQNGIIYSKNNKGVEKKLRRGVNNISYLGRRFQVWYENKRLQSLPDPYKNSYAILVSPGAYSENLKEIYPTLPKALENTRKLAVILEKYGFPPGNIIQLYGSEASSENIDKALKKFWLGGKYQNADRLVFYFSEHGDYSEMDNYLSNETDDKIKVGYLVTSDFEQSHWTTTSFLFDSIRRMHFQHITARQVLFLIDSCSSGLAVSATASKKPSVEELEKNFQKLANFNAEAQLKSRAILVASTGDRRALYDNGGLFTKSLLEGLGERKADYNNDGLINYTELSLYVRETVVPDARDNGFEQRPSDYSIGGKMTFVVGK